MTRAGFRGLPEGTAAVAAAGDPDLAQVRAAQQDRQAFGPLYRRYLRRVYSYAFYNLGNHHDAEDVTERTFVAALSGLPHFHERGSSFRSWLFTIAHHTLANHLRSRSRRRTERLERAVDERAAEDVAATVAQRDEAERVWRAVAALPAERRQVIVLRFVDELSSREIGQVLGRSEGAVRVLLHRALKEVADRLA